MRGCFKCLFKIQYECVNLSSIVQDLSPIIYYRSQRSFTTMSLSECILPIWQEFIFIKMSHDIWTFYVFELLARYTSQGSRAIIARKWPVTLLEKGVNIARDHSFGISLVSFDCRKWLPNTGPNSVTSSFMTQWWSSSDPKALEESNHLRRLVTPFLETTSSIKLADLSGSGTWVSSFLLNTSVNWPLNPSAFSMSDWATPFSFLLFRGGISWCLFLTIDVPIEVSGFALISPTKLFTYKSCFLTSALIVLLKVSNIDLSLLLSVFFVFAWVLFFLRIFPSYLRELKRTTC